MTTSLSEQLKSVVSLEDGPIPPGVLGYFDGASKDEAFDLILSLFQRLAKEKGITRAFLARRTGKSPEQITRLLSAPGNWTLETYTQLALAMGHKPKHALEPLADLQRSNEHSERVAHAASIEAATRAAAMGGRLRVSMTVLEATEEWDAGARDH